MRRIATIATLTAALWAGASAVAQTPPLAAKLTTCETGADPADRYAVFSGSMPRESADVMAMRFELQERLPGEAWEKIPLAGWGEWIRAAKKGVPGFIFTKRLEQLAAPASFRAVVTFRWSDGEGTVLRREKRFSKVCKQPDWRSDLHAASVQISDDGKDARVLVRNRGRGDAGPFAVHVTRADLVKGRTVAGLAAGEEATVSLGIGRCEPGESVTVTLDPAGTVDEVVEDDNVTTVDCPV